LLAHGGEKMQRPDASHALIPLMIIAHVSKLCGCHIHVAFTHPSEFAKTRSQSQATAPTINITLAEQLPDALRRDAVALSFQRQVCSFLSRPAPPSLSPIFFSAMGRVPECSNYDPSVIHFP
jgi:hypothetical protein